MAKTNPIGVRFDYDKAKAIMDTNHLTTYQQLVNHLVDNYVKGMDITPVVRSFTPRPAVVAPAVFKTAQEISQYDAYAGEIRDANNAKELAVIFTFVDKDKDLTEPDRINLKRLSDIRRREFYVDA